jgi:hypothetical protein
MSVHGPCEVVATSHTTAGFGGSKETTFGWIAETFKRFHSSGSKARFCGVQWRSGESGKMNYQENLNNAFLTASNLAAFVNGLPGPSVVVAHSLGNVMVSSAIADHGMNVAKYFLLDAAVPAEAYDTSVTNDTRMVNTWWTDYTNTCWAANWHRLFAPSDTRSRLTWTNRFAAVLSSTTTYNLYSSGDEVFELTDVSSLFSGIFGSWWFIVPTSITTERYTWQKQEVFKGTTYLTFLSNWGGTTTAGWGVETMWTPEPDSEGHYSVVPVYSPEAASAATPSQLATNPVFRHTPTWLVGTNVLTQIQQNEMLAKGIPALTPSAGRTPMTGAFLSGKRFDLNTGGTSTNSFKPNGWPRPDIEPYKLRWLHNDIRKMAFLYTYRAYQRMVELGELK